MILVSLASFTEKSPENHEFTSQILGGFLWIFLGSNCDMFAAQTKESDFGRRWYCKRNYLVLQASSNENESTHEYCQSSKSVGAILGNYEDYSRLLPLSHAHRLPNFRDGKSCPKCPPQLWKCLGSCSHLFPMARFRSGDLGPNGAVRAKASAPVSRGSNWMTTCQAPVLIDEKWMKNG